MRVITNDGISIVASSGIFQTLSSLYEAHVNSTNPKVAKGIQELPFEKEDGHG